MTSEYLRVTLIGLLDTSLPQNSLECARANVIAEVTRYDGDATIGMAVDAVVPVGADAGPSVLLEKPNEFADADGHRTRWGGRPFRRLWWQLPVTYAGHRFRLVLRLVLRRFS